MGAISLLLVRRVNRLRTNWRTESPSSSESSSNTETCGVASGRTPSLGLEVSHMDLDFVCFKPRSLLRPALDAHTMPEDVVTMSQVGGVEWARDRARRLPSDLCVRDILRRSPSCSGFWGKCRSSCLCRRSSSSHRSEVAWSLDWRCGFGGGGGGGSEGEAGSGGRSCRAASVTGLLGTAAVTGLAGNMGESCGTGGRGGRGGRHSGGTGTKSRN